MQNIFPSSGGPNGSEEKAYAPLSNMTLYNLGRSVPAEAQKTIEAGRLKGMTDINPMWRIKKLTEMFGPCGIGWWYDITDKHIVADDQSNQKAAFVDILLYYKDPTSGEVSKGIPGTGGASFVAQERNGAYMSDECYKMALTDAISVSCKAIGIGADVYWAAGRSKYNQETENKYHAKKTVVDGITFDSKIHHPLVCDVCGGEIKAVKTKDRMISAQQMADDYGRCVHCLREGKAQVEMANE